MTIDEALQKIAELKKYIDDQTGFKDDEIFLLSVEEYEKYKDAMPNLRRWWWLRSPGNEEGVKIVILDGSVNWCYQGVYNNVLPALRIEPNDLPIGSRIVKHEFPWIKIDKNLAIAEVPIGIEQFDDCANNCYATSHIRKWLKEWLEERKRIE